MFFEMTTEQQKPEPKLPSPEEEQVPDNGAEETSPTGKKNPPCDQSKWNFKK